MSRSAHWDAIVVGGGHNGLVAGAYLARAGAKTLILEARTKAGGAADTSAPFADHPDVKVSTYSYVMSLMPTTIVRDLKLERYGYRVFPSGSYYQAWPDGSSLKMHAGNPASSYEQIARFSRRDAEAMGRWDEWMDGTAKVLSPLLMTVPPNLGSKSPSDLLETLALAWRFRSLDNRRVADITRLFTMSISDLLDEWFESPQVKSCLAVNGLIGTWAGPHDSGTAYVMAHHSIGGVSMPGGHYWGVPEGGMGAVADAILRSGQASGAETRTSARVSKVLTRSGQAYGVALESGEEILGSVIITTVHPKIAFLEHLDPAELPPEFVRAVQNWKSRSGVVKINLLISELPSFRADPGTDVQEHHTGAVELCLSSDYCDRAFQDARSGRAAARPFVDGSIPTTLDPTLAPDGLHVFSMFSQWVPHEWSERPHREELEAYADRAIDGYDELAPNFKGSVIARQVIGPHDMEQDLGMIGGNIFHGELTPHQLFHMRPAPGYADYRTPVRGLYQASSATHGGGGVTGIPAHLAVKQVVRERRIGALKEVTRKLSRGSHV